VSRVLVVEDEEDLRRLYAASLSLAGFDVTTAADGFQALRRIELDPPDLVLLDLGLPGFAGESVMNELAAHAHTRKIPVVIVSGRGVIGVAAQAACILRKPVAPEELVRTVRTCLSTSTPAEAAEPES
jgi:DNA-binding response OmpR family regulator